VFSLLRILTVFYDLLCPECVCGSRWESLQRSPVGAGFATSSPKPNVRCRLRSRLSAFLAFVRPSQLQLFSVNKNTDTSIGACQHGKKPTRNCPKLLMQVGQLRATCRQVLLVYTWQTLAMVRQYAISDFGQEFDENGQDASDGQTDGEATDESLAGERVCSQTGHNTLVRSRRRLEDELSHILQRHNARTCIQSSTPSSGGSRSLE